MKSKLFLILFIASCPCLGQIKYNYSTYKKNADSILTSMIDEDIFNTYVRLAPKKSYYIKVENAAEKKIGFNEQLSFTPDFYTFSYDFIHPAFSGHSFPIVLTLDHNGHFAYYKHFQGFVIITDSMISSIVSKKKALEYLKESRKPDYKINKSSMKLIWTDISLDHKSFLKTGDVRSLAQYTSIEWRVKGEILFERDKKKYQGHFQINVFNGHVGNHFAIPWD
ncbi:MAG TPA: hypothetical protein VF487_13265 [Chitinophagaceae bacterium]